MKNKVFRVFVFVSLLSAVWGLLFLRFFSVVEREGAAAKAFSVLYAFGHAAEFGIVLLFLLAVFAVFPRRFCAAFAVMLSATLTAFFVVDLFVFRQFRLHITGSMLSMFFSPVSGDIFEFPSVMWIQAGVGFVGIILVMLSLWKAAAFLAGHKWKKIYAAGCILLPLSAVGYNLIHTWASFKEYNPVTVQMQSLPLAYPLSANKMFENMGFQLPHQREDFAPKLMTYPRTFPVIAQEDTLPDIILILFDGWRFDMMDEEITPHIAEFARQSLQFTTHNANANHTRHGVFSLFYGLPGGYWDAALADTVGPVLIDVLLRKNYEFGIYASAALTSPEFHKTVFSQIPDLRLYTQADSAVARDKVITEEFIQFLDSKDAGKPSFSFLFYDSTHAYAYDAAIYPPKFLPAGVKNYFNLPSPGDVEPLLNQYKNAVGYLDVLVGQVFDALKERGLYENSIIILTSDHGEEFNDLGKNYWGHNGNYSIYQTRVPMLIRWPRRAPEVFDYPTSHMDLGPTLMEEVFGTSTPASRYCSGTNLFSPGGRDFIYMQGDEYAIMTDDIITIFRKLGPLETVTVDYAPTDKRVSPEVIRSMLEEISRFKK